MGTDAMDNARHATLVELLAALDELRQPDTHTGRLELIVRRPRVDEREILSEASLSTETGLVGDSWQARASSRTADGSPHPEMQLTLMDARVIARLAPSREEWALAGDQLFVDLDLSSASLPAGTRLAIGTAIIEITPQPHTGCQKFGARFGRDALVFVNAPERRELRLRGANARVIQAGQIRAGDFVTRLPAPALSGN